MQTERRFYEWQAPSAQSSAYRTSCKAQQTYHTTGWTKHSWYRKSYYKGI